MSATHSRQTADIPAGSKAARLRDYLYTQAQEGNGEVYFKSKFIADDVELSPKEIGALMSQLIDTVTEIEIEKWSYTSATTWRVTTST